MDTMINIGSKQSKKNLNKLAVFIDRVFRAGAEHGRHQEEVVKALDLAVSAFSSNGNVFNGCTLKNNKK